MRCATSSRVDASDANGGVMLGMSRTVIGDAASGYEFMYIGPVEGRLSFVARPSGQAGAPSRELPRLSSYIQRRTCPK